MDEATKKRRLEIVRDLMKLSSRDRKITLRLALAKAKRKCLAAHHSTSRLIIKAKAGSKTTEDMLASIQQKSKKANLR